MTKLSELREQGAQELKGMLDDLAKEIFELRNEFKITRKLEKTHLIKEKKRKRAQILTLLREQEIRSLQTEGVHDKS
ncbi:MAG TPA: 50S ribosomal protein L29 [Rhabdochlamydiaceae bacterium]|jgi:large subunit ribosomal protein L29